MPRAAQPDTFDSPWKDVLGAYFQPFMRFFFPHAHDAIDWSAGHEFLDKELSRVARDAGLGTRLADKLVRVRGKNGQDRFVLGHVEVQGSERGQDDFAQRMFVYNYRIYDRYQCPVASFAILADEVPAWKPQTFGYTELGCNVSIEFPVVKLLDLAPRWDELEADDNPFATVVMAHLKAHETRGDPAARRHWKRRLIWRLYERGYSRKDIMHLLRFIDWVLALPPELEQGLRDELHAYEEEQHMRYVTSFERLAREEGKEQGLQQGIEQGAREALLEGIELALELRFGEAGLALLEEIRAVTPLESLRAIHRALRTVASVEEVRRVYRP